MLYEGDRDNSDGFVSGLISMNYVYKKSFDTESDMYEYGTKLKKSQTKDGVIAFRNTNSRKYEVWVRNARNY